jgi:hypothetical protein
MPRPSHVRTNACALVIVLSIGLAGCTGQSTASGASPAPSGSSVPVPSTSPSPPSPGPSQSAPPASGGTSQVRLLVWYQRHGGFAGLTEGIEVQSDGSYTITGRDRASATGKLTATELADLRHELEAVDFTGVPTDSPLRIADGFVHVVRYGGRQFSAGDGNIPKELAPLIARLDRLVHRKPA